MGKATDGLSTLGRPPAQETSASAFHHVRRRLVLCATRPRPAAAATYLLLPTRRPADGRALPSGWLLVDCATASDATELPGSIHCQSCASSAIYWLLATGRRVLHIGPMASLSYGTLASSPDGQGRPEILFAPDNRLPNTSQNRRR
jgi:hypothetical protein